MAQRRLLTSVALPSWPSSELLADSVVRMTVDADGRPVSCVLLQTNGLPEADREALARARALRFAPVSDGGGHTAKSLAGRNWGNVVFEWHTLPPTNAVLAKP